MSSLIGPIGYISARHQHLFGGILNRADLSGGSVVLVRLLHVRGINHGLSGAEGPGVLVSDHQ